VRVLDMVRLTVDAREPDAAAIARAAAAIQAGGLVVVPTDTLYALAANPFDSAAVERVFRVKGRPGDRALLLIASDLAQVTATLGPMPAAAVSLARRFWPGPLTLLVPAPAALAAGLTAGAGHVGVRVPAHPVARALCAACGHPLTATSANLSGAPASADAAVASRSLESAVDFVLDAGPTPGGPPSTIVDVSNGRLTLVRPGAIEWKEIQGWLHDGRPDASARPSSD
jgi:L-threonylcarbamoyladenylate synthase